MDVTSSLVNSSLVPETPLTNPNVDLLWRNRSRSSADFGKTVLWKMEDVDLDLNASSVLVDNATGKAFNIADESWTIVGAADQNLDGRSDYLWRNTVTGENAWWLMDSSGIRYLSAVWLPEVKDTNWSIVGVADLNGDRQVDLMWRNRQTGENAWWLMQDQTIAGVQFWTSLSPTFKDWVIKGVGDADRDGRTDVFWSNEKTGDMTWWLMGGLNGAEQVRSITLSATVNGKDEGFRAQGVADFNGDGEFDLVMRNDKTGENSLWLVDGSSVLDRYVLTPVGGDMGWEIVALVRQPAQASRRILVESLSMPPKNSADNPQVEPRSSARFFDRNQLLSTQPDQSYSFSIDRSGVWTANLTGLSNGDADIQLIQDINGNGRLDASDSIISLEWERGTQRESLRKFLQPGQYFLQVKNYSQQTLQYTVSSNFVAAVADDQAFKIQINFKAGTEGLNNEARNAIWAAAQFWESAIVTRPALTQFKNLTIDITGRSIDGGILAEASPFVTTDGKQIFIVSGEATLDINRYANYNQDPNSLRMIMVHEFAHVLGFGTLWTPVTFPQRGTIGNTWINASNSTYLANSYAGSAYAGLLGRSGTAAIPLSSDLSHWDETRFDTELMTPFAEARGVTMPASMLTLSALRDLGWRINLAMAQPYNLPSSSSSPLFGSLSPQILTPEETVALT